MADHPKLYRQGDVLLRQISGLPENVEVSARGRLVLAEGELTGHAHVIEHGRAGLAVQRNAVYTMPWDEISVYLVVDDGEPVALRHDEHDTLKVEPGVYQVIRQRQLDMDRMVAWVAD
jgi:hypothetical protein